MVGSHMNITHVDEGALKWLESIRPGFSFLDIGCGPMGMVDLALESGHDAWGMDADRNLINRVKYPDRLIIHDLKRSSKTLVSNFDVVWSVEVVEHIHEEYIDNWIRSVRDNLFSDSRGLLIMTHATGINFGSHVNCHPSEYWINSLSANGMNLESDLTAELKKHSTMQREFIQNTGMVFSRV